MDTYGRWTYCLISYFSKMKTIYTNKREEIIVDDELYDELNKRKWYLVNGYAETTVVLMSRKESRETGKPRLRSLKMHRFIYDLVNKTKINSSQHIDHKNRNKTDNRISNLRISNPNEDSINAINVGLRSDNTTGYKGVTKRMNRKTSKPYEAKISYRGKRISIGSYATAKEAALAYNKKAIELFDDACYINPIA